jgi:hypothetical protein
LEQIIVKRQTVKSFVKPLVVVIGLAFGGAALAAEAKPAGGVYATESANGSVELSNLPTTDSQQPVVAAPDPATVVPAPAAPTAAPAQADAAGADPQKDPREQYRDNMLKSDQAVAGPTSNASRRYKMMDKATYQATVLGNQPTAAEPAK